MANKSMGTEYFGILTVEKAMSTGGSMAKTITFLVNPEEAGLNTRMDVYQWARALLPQHLQDGVTLCFSIEPNRFDAFAYNGVVTFRVSVGCGWSYLTSTSTFYFGCEGVLTRKDAFDAILAHNPEFSDGEIVCYSFEPTHLP